MKRVFVVVLMAVMAMSGMAQHHPNHHGEHGRGGRHHIECATREQMQMTMQVLEQQPFDDKRLEICKLCVTLGHFCTDDLARMAAKFSFDDNRLLFLQYAYGYCEDPENYYMLRDVFAFRSNFDKLMESVMPGYRR